MRASNLSERLIVTPILEGSQIGSASIDVRLGFDFVSIRRGNVRALETGRNQDTRKRFRMPHHLNLGEEFFLHPHEMVLASTIEYVRLPTKIAGYVTSRSRWGRLGLVIATATAIHPGFTGTITLELVNHGNVPIVLHPGLCIAQLILNEAVGSEAYAGEMSKQTGPLAARAADVTHRDTEFWTQSQNGSH
jgi:dCTP deaminase